MPFMILVVVATTMVSWWIATRHLGFDRRRLSVAAVTTLECLGLAVVFLGINLGVAAVFVVVSRSTGFGFVSAYIASDFMWVVFSVLQAIVFHSLKLVGSSQGKQ